MKRRLFFKIIGATVISASYYKFTPTKSINYKFTTKKAFDIDFLNLYLRQAFPSMPSFYSLRHFQVVSFSKQGISINLLTKKAFGVSITDLKNIPPHKAAKLFEQCRTNDFKQLSLVEEKGWVFSSSEHALLALFDLS